MVRAADPSAFDVITRMLGARGPLAEEGQKRLDHLADLFGIVDGAVA